MRKTVTMTEPGWLQIIKTILLAASAFGYTWPLITGMAHVVVPIAVIVAAALAYFCVRKHVRTLGCILLSAAFILIGFIGSDLTLNTFGMFTFSATIQSSRFWYYAGLVFGVVFLSRSLALRYRTLQIIEACLLIGTLDFIFFAHRDFNLTNPRAFADYLYSRSRDPIEVYRLMGIAISFLALPLLIGRAKFSRIVYSMVTLAILSLVLASISADWRLPINVEDPLGIGNLDKDEDKGDQETEGEPGDGEEGESDNEDDESDGSSSGSNENSDKNQGGGGGNSDSQMPSPNNRPTPVAIAVFYDEYNPSDGEFHFRQNVLSEYNGNHLVSSDMDTDVISTMPGLTALDAEPVQNPLVHTKISTSMFLLEEHPQPPQVAMGQHVFPIENPDPKLYVGAYAVDSLGLTMDITRLIGRHSVPADWSEEKKAHYLQIPDDPRYRALSDIIVRQIDPRFMGDDIVKALYIKSWLEKEGYYTQKIKHIDANDPTASFLFGSLRGYCVHFAHAAVYLFRSQGIAARVALGYSVDNRMRGTNSAVLILGNTAHAWPEIYVDGIGWVTFDIYPENGDTPPNEFIDQDLESLFGELARNDKSGGKAPEATQKSMTIPWGTLWKILGCLFIIFILGCYLRKIMVIVYGNYVYNAHFLVRPLRGTILMWRMYGHDWRPFHTLEEFARSECGADSNTAQIISLGVSSRLGDPNEMEIDCAEVRRIYKKALAEAAQHTPVWRRIVGWLNPWVTLG